MVRAFGGYDEAVGHLNSLMPELFTGAAVGLGLATGVGGRRKFSLEQIRVLAGALGDPQRRFAAVLIAGTNGKGSTAATLAAIAQTSGLRVGLYTSPHLARVNERMRVDGKDISDERFAALYFRVVETAERLVRCDANPEGLLPQLPSYFELLTAVAFVYFAEPEDGEEPVALAILEVGMGGRLDATNLVDPVVSVITDISLDHQEWLGDTIAEIAREKAGILRAGGTLVTLPQHPEANQALGEIAVGLGVKGISAAEYMPGGFGASGGGYAVEVMGERVVVESPLAGAHQQRNVALAIAAAVELAEGHGFAITPGAIEAGIRETRWPGRLELIRVAGWGDFVLDVAHNPAGAWALRAALGREGLGRAETTDGAGTRCLIFSCLKDKPLREMAQILFPIFDYVVLTPIRSARATEMAELVAAAESTGVAYRVAESAGEAMEIARKLEPRPETVVISGSVYLVGELRPLLLELKAVCSFGCDCMERSKEAEARLEAPAAWPELLG